MLEMDTKIDLLTASVLTSKASVPSSSNIKLPFTKLSSRNEYASWRDSCPILASSTTSPYRHLVEVNINGYYTFKQNLNQEENRDLYAITIQSIDKKIVSSIILGEPALRKKADGMLLS